MKRKNDLLTLASMQYYDAPKLPTLETYKPDLLKNVPSRWKNKMKMTTVAGLFGMTLLTGCSVYEALMPVSDYDYYLVDDWMHHGGSGGAPLYIAYLTEQEALEIIKTQLEKAGLNFEEISSRYHLQVDNWATAELILADEERDLTIAFIDRWWTWHNEDYEIKERLEITEAAIQQFRDEFGVEVSSVIFNPTDEVWNENDKLAIKAGFEEDLTRQVQNFIEQLRTDGVVE